ncbi:M20/M25/M40 family metallo-hydrolase [Parvibaculum sp.]|uniref:M20/M25/M40 family metallo-hydrolase n=1 Tax=Parvibaculum sp. TaxID=2024848 RepID=UPI00320EB513
MKSWLFLAAIAAAFLLAALAVRTPAPRHADIPAREFSAARAMEDIRVIAARPHPIGSADASRVRAYLVSRMAALGLSPRLGLGQGTFSLPARRIFVAGRVVNIVGLLPGTQRDLPAILIMAHYDTVPNSPGAADDTAGGASALEIVANLKAAGPRLRDVVILFTDGEEAGLLGSDAFFANDPLARRVGLVINLEARGGGGRAMMFETNGKVGGVVSAYGHAAALPSANSLAAFVYRHMPNGTDFTNAARHGKAGLNFAYVGDELAYHTAHATPENIDPASVQHMGASVLGLVARLSNAREYPDGGGERVYADVLGQGFIAYPVWGGWLIVATSAALLAFAAIRWRQRGALRAGDMLRGVCLFLGMTLGVGLVLGLVGWLMLGFTDMQLKYALLSRYGFVLGGYVALAAGLALSLAGVLLRRSFAGRDAQTEGLWFGGLALLLAASVGLQIAAPVTAFIAAWPLLVASLAAALPPALLAGRDRLVLVAATAIGTIGAAQAAEWGVQIFGALGVNVPALLTVQVATVSVLLWPSMLALLRSARAWATPLALIVLGGASVLYARFAPADAAHPRLTEAFYAAGPGAQDFQRIADFPRLDDWSLAALRSDGGEVEREEFQPFLPSKVWSAPAKPVPVAKPSISVVKNEARGDRRLLTLRLAPARGGRELRLFVEPSVDLADVAINGQPVSASMAAGVWTGFGYAAPPAEGVLLSFSAGASGRVEAKLAEVADGWPEGAAVPPKPEGLMPWRYSDVTVGLTDFSTAW